MSYMCFNNLFYGTYSYIIYIYDYYTTLASDNGTAEISGVSSRGNSLRIKIHFKEFILSRIKVHSDRESVKTIIIVKFPSHGLHSSYKPRAGVRRAKLDGERGRLSRCNRSSRAFPALFCRYIIYIIYIH